jgi:ABC-type nitrate/sulfonate/bicarbonate transport system substrate-binding protein
MLTRDRDVELSERLNRHPQLRARVESLLAVVEDAAGDCAQADAAERRVIEELRRMGNDVLTAWAERGVEKHSAAAQAEPEWRPAGKKTVLVHDLRPDRSD